MILSVQGRVFSRCHPEFMNSLLSLSFLPTPKLDIGMKCDNGFLPEPATFLR